MIGAAGPLDQRMAQRAQGLLIPGYPDDGRTEAFNQLPFEWDVNLMEFRRLPGVRDACALGDGSEVILRDPRYRRWHRAGREMTAKEVLRRYAFFASHGDPNPTPNNDEACPAMAQPGIRSALMGARWLEADPAVWGN